MKLNEIRPMLWTKDLRGSVEFYTNVLGFKCQALIEEWGWASVSLDTVSIMFTLPTPHELFEKPTFTGSLYINTDEVDTLWQRLKDHVKICYPLETFEYGMREFAIYDNNGYLLQFGQEIDEQS